MLDDRRKLHYIAEKISEDVQIWHKRLGHLPTIIMKKLHFLQNKVSVCSFTNYIICPLARQTSKPFALSTSRSAAVFHLLHVDIWDLYKVPNLHGHRYFLIIADNHSKMIWVFLVKLKSDTLLLFKFFVKMVIVQFDK